MNKKTLELGTEPVGKLLRKYSIPAIIGLLVNGLYNVVDRIFIGNIPEVGSSAIAGVGIVAPIMVIIMAFGMLIGIGAVSNVSIKLGQKKHDEVKSIIVNAFILSFAIGIFLSLITLVLQNPMYKAFGASEETIKYAKAYGTVILYATPFGILSMVINNLLRGDGNPKLASALMIIGCLLNIVLDATFIFGFNMGIQGAAIATVISQVLTSVIGILYFALQKSHIKITKEDFIVDFGSIKAICIIGSAPFIMQIVQSLILILINNVAKIHGGDLAIGAMATIMSITTLFVMPIAGIGQGAQPIVGFNYGARQYEKSKRVFKLAVMVSAVWLTFVWLIVLLLPVPIVSLFTNDQVLIDMTANGLRKYLLALPIICLPFISTNYMQSIGKPKQAMVLSLLRQVVFLIPMIFLLPQFIGIDGVWFAQPIADVAAATMAFVIITLEFKKTKNVFIVE